MDAADASCPIRRVGGRHIPECPKCKATVREACAIGERAVYDFIRKARAALQPKPTKDG